MLFITNNFMPWELGFLISDSGLHAAVRLISVEGS